MPENVRETKTPEDQPDGHTSGVSRLTRLLRPRSIVVFGGQPAERVIEQCDLLGFEGPIWPVHPTRSEIRGRRCYADVASLPGVPDAA